MALAKIPPRQLHVLRAFDAEGQVVVVGKVAAVFEGDFGVVEKADLGPALHEIAVDRAPDLDPLPHDVRGPIQADDGLHALGRGDAHQLADVLRDLGREHFRVGYVEVRPPLLGAHRLWQAGQAGAGQAHFPARLGRVGAERQAAPTRRVRH